MPAAPPYPLVVTSKNIYIVKCPLGSNIAPGCTREQIHRKFFLLSNWQLTEIKKPSKS